MFLHRVPVRWNDLDAAGIVYFPVFLDYCHGALEALFGSLPGGYAGFVLGRRLGVPTVHLETDFVAPLRYGDVCLVQLEVEKLGRSSLTLRHALVREADAVLCARVRHVVSVSALEGPRSVPMPDDVRALFMQHLVAPARTP